MGRTKGEHERAVDAYTRAVRSGRRPAGLLERLAVDRHLRDMRAIAGKRPKRTDIRFDRRAAERACDFFGLLRHSKGRWAGQPFRLEPWQTFIVWSLFGWKRADGRRRFTFAYVEVARKNGKSTFAAGLGLLLAFFDGEPGAEAYCAATKRDQARIVHGEAVRMARSSPGLGIKIYRDNLHVVETASKFEPLGADADTTDGLNVHCAIIDEFHAHPSRDLLDRIDTATGARTQPMIFVITTAGDDEMSPCYQERERCRSVLQGQLEDDSLFALIFAPDAEDDWNDPDTWEKGNPNLGVSIDRDDFAQQQSIARQTPARENAFRRFKLNQWVQASTRFLSFEDWKSCSGGITVPRLEAALEGAICYAGLDLSSKSDLTALALVFPPPDPEKCEPDGDPEVRCQVGTYGCAVDHEPPAPYDVLWRFWLPEGYLRRPGRPKTVPFEQWAEGGFLSLTPGDAIDQDFIFHEISELVPRFQIAEVMVDRWGANFIRPKIEDLGLVVAEFGQGYASMSEPTKQLEALVLQRRICHGGHPVAAWNADCLEVRTDPAGNIKPSKPDTRKSAKRIDGMVALIMALARAMLPSDQKVSPYEERGLVVI